MLCQPIRLQTARVVSERHPRASDSLAYPYRCTAYMTCCHPSDQSCLRSGCISSMAIRRISASFGRYTDESIYCSTATRKTSSGRSLSALHQSPSCAFRISSSSAGKKSRDLYSVMRSAICSLNVSTDRIAPSVENCISKPVKAASLLLFLLLLLCLVLLSPAKQCCIVIHVCLALFSHIG